MTTHRIAAFPPRILKDRNPYARLLYREMELAGFETIDASPLTLDWLLRARRHVDILHFHWDPQQKYVQRCPDRVTLLLRRLRRESLVPWWDVVSFVTLLAAARTLGYRLVWTIHEICPHESDHARHDIRASRALARLSHLLLAHDTATAVRAREALKLPSAEIHVVPHGSYVGVYPPGRDRDTVRSELGVPRDAFVFLAFGHLRGYKELPLLLDAFMSLPLPSARLIVAGVPWDAGDAKTCIHGRRAGFQNPCNAGCRARRASRGTLQCLGRSSLPSQRRVDIGIAHSRDVHGSSRPGCAAAHVRGFDGWRGSRVAIRTRGCFFLQECLFAAAANPAQARSKGALALSRARQMSWEGSAAITARLFARACYGSAERRRNAPTSTMRRS